MPFKQLMATSQLHLDISACQRGDREAQRLLFEEYNQRVFRLAGKIVGKCDAADLTQQIFLKVFQKISQFEHQSQFQTWLYRLATNECLQHLRSRARNREFSADVDVAAKTSDSTMGLDDCELLEMAMNRLDPDLRMIFQLREIEMLNYAELAEVLQISEGTVGSRLNRARKLLREHLIDLGWES
ncbi:MULTISPECIES: RNA polymerase sigma factor [Thalassoglobus]|uniref:ECF RNA polymerase sigma-E factor n=1 Tax=Thalassoglobus polymorphus TaxID=2527994 RepID=A0A517QK60_9PLAN|nr:sigma-70 family RNA polymerase sigma factor [Thalassoglobus polymorphus]QDT31984.1 ECF RNA polymerase sigma-E factor [Thalassoglobus polymorphus]